MERVAATLRMSLMTSRPMAKSIQADDEEGSLGRRQRRNGQEEEGLLPEAPQVHGDPGDDRGSGHLLEAEAGQRSRRRRVARASPSRRRVTGTEAHTFPTKTRP